MYKSIALFLLGLGVIFDSEYFLLGAGITPFRIAIALFFVIYGLEDNYQLIFGKAGRLGLILIGVFMISDLINSASINIVFSLSMLTSVVSLGIVNSLDPSSQKVILKGALFGIFVFIISYYANFERNYTEDRLRLFWDNSNNLALKFTLIPTLFLIINGFKLWTLILVALSFPAIFETGSRGGLVLTILLIIVVITSMIQQKSASRGWISMMIISTLLLIFVNLEEITQKNIMIQRVSNTEALSSDSRVDYLNLAVPELLDFPLVGIGSLGYDSFTRRILGNAHSLHNGFVDVFAYSGTIGLLLFLAIIREVLINSQKDTKLVMARLKLLTLLCVVFVVFKSGSILSNKLVWLSLGLLNFKTNAPAT